MSNEPQTGTSQQQPSKPLPSMPKDNHVPVEEEEEEEEIMTMTNTSMYDKVYELAEKFATTSMGQFVIERGDRMLKTIESTAKWSLPQDEKSKLERHLPWLPFLMLIIMLRMARIWLSVGALLIGNGPVSAHDVVYFIQTRRRKLRAIRVHGIKAIRRREMEAKRTATASSANGGFLFKLRQLMSSAICRPGRNCEPGRRMIVRDRPSKEQLNISSQAAKRRREDDCVDMNLTCDQMLSKYANENSEDDSDFIPNPNEEMDSSETSLTSSDDDTNDEDPAPTTENGHQVEDAKMDKSIIEMSSGRKQMLPKPLVEIKNEQLTDVESGNELATPKMSNGPSGNGNGNMEVLQPADTAEVANKSTATTKLQPSNPMNGHAQEKLATPGHESAAQVKPRVLDTTAVAAAPADIDARPTDTNADDGADERLMKALSQTPPVLVYSKSFPTTTAPSCFAPPSPLLAVSLDECIFNASLRASEASTSTLSLNSFESCCTLTSLTSNEEDMFYSPIGSPPDFNVAFKPVSILKNTTNITKVDAHSTPKTSEECAMKSATPTTTTTTTEPTDDSDVPKKSSTGPGHSGHKQTHNQSSHYHQHNRNRGKNRR